MTKPSQKVEIFLIDGTPFGLRYADINGKTCRAFACPRRKLEALLNRQEMKEAGVYFLINSITAQVYIGQSDMLSKRLYQHRSKAWWTEVVAFITHGDGLDAGGVQYCESVLVQRAKLANQYKLVNENAPAINKLSEANKAVMDGFIDQIILLLSVLGYKNIYSTDEHEDEISPLLFLKLSSENLIARGRKTDNGFIVYKGSHARTKASATYEQTDYNRRNELIQKGDLKPDISSNHLIFSKDVSFRSSSSAAATILGRSASGPNEWKTEDGKPLKELQS